MLWDDRPLKADTLSLVQTLLQVGHTAHFPAQTYLSDSDKLIAIGEVGLGGEVRSVPNLEQRLHEAERIGFERAVIPKHSLAHLNAADYPGMKLVGAAYIADAINALKNDRL